MSAARLIVVGIGADGWSGLGERARAALRAADEVVGSCRQLELLDESVQARRTPWPSPLEPLLDELVARREGRVCVLASGDPMLYGIGATLARRVDPERLEIHPHPSALALACARLGWPEAEVELVSVVGRPLDTLSRALQPGRRVIVFSSGGDGAERVARLVAERGYGPSRLVVLEQLGGPGERIVESSADAFGGACDPLHVVAIECRRNAHAPLLARVPGLPDDAYESDGALTKRHVRAATLAALAPTPGALLWDVGAGSGSIAIEWMRAERDAQAIAIEAREDRAARIERNAAALGVPTLQVVRGTAPQALDGLPRPDAVFVGGGVGERGLLERCLDALAPGGRIVANAVTLEGERTLHAALVEHGGELVRMDIAHAEPLGGFTGWRPQRPVVQWSAIKEVQ